jgi:peptide subunit release factor 1 (eRF1)
VELLDILEEAARERVATSPSDVLQALSERRVDTLVIDGDFATAGVRCPSCGWIGLDRSTCPWDETKVEERADVVDDAVDLALMQAARVVSVDDDAERHPPAPLGALLRY